MRLYRIITSSDRAWERFHDTMSHWIKVPRPDVMLLEDKNISPKNVSDSTLRNILASSRGQFWFTPKGWAYYGKRVLENVSESFPTEIKVIQEDVDKDLLDLALYRDEYQVAL